MADLEWHSSSNDSPVPNSQASPMKLPNRKRSHSNHLDGLAPYEESSKSRRTSPSPYTTGPPTPSTISSDDDAFAAEFLQMQKEEERRRVQEKADADFARSLQTESGFHINLPSSTGPSAYDRMSGVRQPSTTLFARPHHSQVCRIVSWFTLGSIAPKVWPRFGPCTRKAQLRNQADIP